MKKQNIVFVSVLAAFIIGLLGIRFWYDSKCVKFQDKNMELQTLYLLDNGRGRVLKTELPEIESFYVKNRQTFYYSGRLKAVSQFKPFGFNIRNRSYDRGRRR